MATPAKKPVAKKPATPAKKPVGAKRPVASLEPQDGTMAQYSPEDQAKIEQLKEAGVKFEGTETSEELDAKLAAIEETGEEGEEETEDDDLPRKTAPRYQSVQVEGKPRRFPIHFVLTANGKHALYNELGTRISPVYGSEDVLPGSTSTNAVRSINRAAARNNAVRRTSMLPGDYLPA